MQKPGWLRFTGKFLNSSGFEVVKRSFHAIIRIESLKQKANEKQKAVETFATQWAEILRTKAKIAMLQYNSKLRESLNVNAVTIIIYNVIIVM